MVKRLLSNPARNSLDTLDFYAARLASLMYMMRPAIPCMLSKRFQPSTWSSTALPSSQGWDRKRSSGYRREVGAVLRSVPNKGDTVVEVLAAGAVEDAAA
eukprot:3916559-Prorocentrum_lima.AAC.1